jgi:hypothetical protein
MGTIGPSDVLGALLAAISGVAVALFTHYLGLGRDAAKERRLLANTRALLALEVRSNRDALAAFWRTVTTLGNEPRAVDAPEDLEPLPQASGKPIQPDPVQDLASMYANGLVTYALPLWSSVRWNAIEPRTVAALTAAEVAALDGLYRALRDVTDLYARVATITPDEWADLRKNVGGRFWTLDLARERQRMYARLTDAIARVLDAADPLPGAIADGK